MKKYLSFLLNKDEHHIAKFKLLIEGDGEIYLSNKDLLATMNNNSSEVEHKYIESSSDLLERGKEWLYSYTQKYQPQTAKILLDGSDLFVFKADEIMEGWGSNYYLVQKLFEDFLIFDISLKGKNPYNEGFELRFSGFLRSLPKEIYMAYYYHFEGIQPMVDGDIISAGSYSRLPVKRQFIQSMENYLRSINRFNKKTKTWIENHFPGKMHTNALMLSDSNPLWGTNLSIFLDTRVNKREKDGDVFFVKVGIDDKVIYHIKDGDIENMRILSNYVEAIDKYCTHTLLGNEERFDFFPYTSDFVSPTSLYPEEVYEITKEEIELYRGDWTSDDEAKWDKFAPYRKKFEYSIP